MKTLEHKDLTIVFDSALSKDLKPRCMRGYASTWDLDQGGDVIRKGAFKNSLIMRHQLPMAVYGSSNLRFLYDHDTCIGRIEDIQEDDQGLLVTAYFSETTKGNDIYTLVKDRALSKMSIGFFVINASYDFETGIRYIEEADLIEASIVKFPMNEATEILEVRGIVEDHTPVTMDDKIENLLSAYHEIKAGKEISNANRRKLLGVINSLCELISMSTPSDEDTQDQMKDENQTQPSPSQEGQDLEEEDDAEDSTEEEGESISIEITLSDPLEELENNSENKKGEAKSTDNIETIKLAVATFSRQLLASLENLK